MRRRASVAARRSPPKVEGEGGERPGDGSGECGAELVDAVVLVRAVEPRRSTDDAAPMALAASHCCCTAAMLSAQWTSATTGRMRRRGPHTNGCPSAMMSADEDVPATSAQPVLEGLQSPRTAGRLEPGSERAAAGAAACAAVDASFAAGLA